MTAENRRSRASSKKRHEEEVLNKSCIGDVVVIDWCSSSSSSSSATPRSLSASSSCRRHRAAPASAQPAGWAGGRHRASSSVIDCIRALTRLAPHCTALPLARSLVRPLSLTASPARLSSISPIDWACESYRLLSTHCLSNSLALCFARCPFIALCDLKHVSAYRPLSAYRKYRLIGDIFTPLS